MGDQLSWFGAKTAMEAAEHQNLLDAEAGARREALGGIGVLFLGLPQKNPRGSKKKDLHFAFPLAAWFFFTKIKEWTPAFASCKVQVFLTHPDPC